MRLNIGILLLVILFTATVGAAQAKPGERPDFGGDHSFSYALPEGWAVRDFPGYKYKISTGPAAEQFAPNVLVVDEAFPGSLEDYVKASIEGMHKMIAGVNIISQNDFTTEDSTRGIKVVSEREDSTSGTPRKLRQIGYYFDAGNGKKLIAMATTLQNKADQFEPVFDATMKTFKIEKPSAMSSDDSFIGKLRERMKKSG
jgi:hypothetical protein